MFNRLLLCLVMLIFCSCRETVVHNLSETEANRMLAHLFQQNIDVRKEKQTDGRWALSVEKEKIAQSIRTLDVNKLLKNELPVMEEKTGLVSSREQERFRFERSLSREIEATLSALPDILQARVHLNLPSSDPLLGVKTDDSLSSGSVMLISSSGNINKEDIVSLVSGASGIKASQISLMIHLAEQKPFIEDPAIGPAIAQNSSEATLNHISDKAEVTGADFIKQAGNKIKYLLSWPLIVVSLILFIFVLVFRQLHRRSKIII